ncbi:MAG: lysine exporter LysO family protein, partial [Firmicutes bacterium]|nr:lysine exporter LysO family protein [Bacillota bacterium]
VFDKLALGTMAFLANLLRELLALLLIPLVARRLGKVMAVAPAGATAMDSTLPVISRFTDPQTAVIAFLSGAALTAISPFLIPFLVGFVFR